MIDPMHRWGIGGLLFTAVVGVPLAVHWLRHRPHRLSRPTQDIVFWGIVAQLALLAAALLMWWFR